MSERKRECVCVRETFSASLPSSFDLVFSLTWIEASPSRDNCEKVMDDKFNVISPHEGIVHVLDLVG